MMNTRAFQPSRVLPEMSEFGIGLWSWWLLFTCGRSKIIDPNEDLAPVRMLWLHKDRDQNLKDLAAVDGYTVPSMVNKGSSVHPPVHELYSDDLIKLVESMDGATHSKALAKRSGVEYPFPHAAYL